MSEHPYRYSPYQGQKPHSQPLPPFAQQSLPSLNAQPPYYGAFQQPVATAGNYATTHNSFQYNATTIPGLGMGSSLPPMPYRPEHNSIWQPHTQPALHQLPTQARDKSPVFTAKQGNLQKSPMEKRDIPVSSQTQKHTPEEGELSEGEFEDLYEPKDNTDIAIPTPPSPRPPSVMENQNGSVGDADGSSIYDGTTPRGEAVVNSIPTSFPTAEREYSPDGDWEPSYQERERSGSYSPYLSPREIQRRVSVSKPASHGIKQAPNIQNPVQSLPGINMTHLQQPPVKTPLANGTAPNQTQDATTRPFRSVAEAKKKAQEAILGLWPLKVRYQDYIEEGLDEKLIKGLFTDLGLEASIPKPTTVQKTASDPQVPAAPSNLSQAAPESQNAKPQPPIISKPKPSTTVETAIDTSTTGDTKPSKKTAAEERKDKIARKLAAKAQKTVNATQPPASAPPSQPVSTNLGAVTSTSASPAKPKTRAENNALLHQKLAKLKKAQEKALAEKLAADNAAKPMTPPSLPTSNPPTIAVSKNNIESTTNATTVTTSVPEADRRSMSTEKSLPRDGGIPGLFLTTQPTQSSNRNLKRPVASDFDSYSTPTGTLKRTRTQETLIIDVSDDEDVEMDIASPTDEPNSFSETINPPRQIPLAAFPPLSDSLNRKQRSSPSSSTAPTPPVHGAKLDLLHKRIEETKRLIAEAEAKKAAKKTNAPQSPQTQPSVMESTTLPKISEFSQVQKRVGTADVKRRDRIVSYELPTVEATLKEKQERLREAVAQAAQLELEIQASMEQRRKLADEAERLAVPAEPIPIEISTQNQLAPSAIATTTSEPSHIETQPTSEQQPNSEEMTDISMTEGESTQHEHPVDSNNAQLGLDSSQSVSPTDNEPAAVQLSQGLALVNGESQAEAGISGVSQNSSTNASTDENRTILKTTADVSEVQVDRQDLSKEDVSERPSREPSLSNDGSYQPQSTPASPTHDNPLGSQNTSTKTPSQEQINLYNDEQLSREVLHEASLLQPGEESALSAPENPSGEVQNSSSYEHPLLTSNQDESEKPAQPEDLLSYHSPLGYFRAYRFHPKYFDEVAGGLKSMTYSSKIDPMRPLCPRVLAGEQCPDGNACEFQHFENMVLPDAEIITQLGSADMFTGETRNRFIEGLKKVLNELKANKVKDFDRITKAIVKHRQEFLEDKSKVLPLDAGSS
ncbi:hypothetical protein F5Y00DRAFT_270383 [Daldinia vernicosa]|uniref:uncharacterized protein n=1 Tax=Daldinia vernicosa TaxID=114800 RepID=UPI00200720E0|nr:uncharacterized protein F5Y00DRAFT_270383 [Daldinia vernicosa]KAI0848157.1 hypothetical protein F5Y00DRAFT_270383 [Daldinia vernicosa]